MSEDATVLAEDSYEWYRREVARFEGELIVARNRIAGLEKTEAELFARAERAEACQHAANALLASALRMLMYGERPPGSGDTWRDWRQATQAHLDADAPGGES